MGTTKARYIELYGEDAWIEEQKRRKQASRNYYLKNSERIKQRVREYSDNNKEKIKEYRKKYYNDNKDKELEKQREYVDANKDKIRLYQKEYYLNHKELRDYREEYSKNYRNTKEGKATNKYHQYYRDDKINEREGFNLTKEWILDNIFKSKCIYCGDNNWKHLGCDRIDNTKAHKTDNVVCSCAVCNVERYYNKMSVEEFIEYRKTHPRELKRPKLQEIAEVNGKRVIRKAGV